MTKKKTQQQVKQQQANMQSDVVDMEGFSEGVLTMGTGTLSDSVSLSYDGIDTVSDSLSVSYDMGDIGQTNFDYDNDLRDKYPALKDAWDHYNNVKQLCESKEKEEDEDAV